MSCGQIHSSPSSSKIQCPLSQLQHSRFTRALTFRLCGGVSRLPALMLHQRRRRQAPHIPFPSARPLWKGCALQAPDIRVHVGKRSVHVLPKLLPAPLMVNAQKVRFFHGKLCHAHTSISFCLVFAAAFFGAVFSLPAASCARTEGRILRIPLLLSSPLSISA